MAGISKRVLIITYYWPPSGGAGVQRWLKFTKYLPAWDWEPVVLTVKEENASYGQRDESLADELSPTLKVTKTPSFEPYSLYLRFSGKKEIPYGGFSNENNPSLFQKISRFIRGNFFIPDPRRGWNRYALQAAKKLMKEEEFDAMITTGPPHSTHLIGYRLKKQTGIKWIADFREPWTDIYYYQDLSHSFLAKWYDRKLEKKVLLTCDKIVTVGNVLKELFLSKSHQLSSDKVEVITNGYDAADFEGFDKSRAENFTITYTGTVSPYYRLEGFVLALKQLPLEIRNIVLIRFVGNISQNVIDLFEQAELSSQFEYVGYVTHSKSVEYLFKSSVLLLLIPDVKENKGILTGKFFEYLATGRPILAIGPTEGDVAFILEETGAGEIVDYNNVQKLSETIRKFYEDYKAEKVNISGEEIQKYSRKNLTGRLVRILEQ